LNIFGSFYRFNKDDLSPAVIFEKGIASPVAIFPHKKGLSCAAFFKNCLYNKKKLTVPQSARKLVTSHH